jgi:hypothetical protein
LFASEREKIEGHVYKVNKAVKVPPEFQEHFLLSSNQLPFMGR